MYNSRLVYLTPTKVKAAPMYIPLKLLLVIDYGNIIYCMFPRDSKLFTTKKYITQRLDIPLPY